MKPSIAGQSFIHALLLLACLSSSPAQTILLPLDATWKYHAQGIDLGTDWRGLDYDDSMWPSGPAQLGYGDGDEMTSSQPPPGVRPPFIFDIPSLCRLMVRRRRC